MRLRRRRNARREEAIERQKARDARTPQQQLKILDEKYGKGIGAKKERARLAKQIEKISDKKKSDKKKKN